MNTTAIGRSAPQEHPQTPNNGHQPESPVRRCCLRVISSISGRVAAVTLKLWCSLVLGAAWLTLTFAAVAYGDPASAIRDCATDGDLDSRYSNRELREAIDRLPSDLAEYSNCREIFEGAVALPASPASQTKPAVPARGFGAPDPSPSSAGAPKEGKTGAVSPSARLTRPEAVSAGSAPVSERQLEEGASSSLLVWMLVAGCVASAGLVVSLRRRASNPRTR